MDEAMRLTGPALSRCNRRTGASPRSGLTCVLVLTSLIYPGCVWKSRHDIGKTFAGLGSWSLQQRQLAQVRRHATGNGTVVTMNRPERFKPQEVQFGQEFVGVVIHMGQCGAILDINCEVPAWLPIGRICEEEIETVEEVTDFGEIIKVRAIGLKSNMVDVTAIDLPIFYKRPLSSFSVGDTVEGVVIAKKKGKIGKTKGKTVVFVDIGATANGGMLYRPEEALKVIRGHTVKMEVTEILEPFSIFLRPLGEKPRPPPIIGF